MSENESEQKDEAEKEGEHVILFALLQDDYGRVKTMQRIAAQPTEVDTIRNALRLYEWYAQNVIQNHERLQLVKAGIVREIELIFDQPEQKERRRAKREERYVIRAVFTERTYRRLQEIQRKTAQPTENDTIRNALRLYEWYLQNVVENGEQLRLAKENFEREVALMF